MGVEVCTVMRGNGLSHRIRIGSLQIKFYDDWVVYEPQRHHIQSMGDQELGNWFRERESQSAFGVKTQ